MTVPKHGAPSVFISYVSSDLQKAREVAQCLKTIGIRPWLDKDQLVLGDSWEHEIKQAVMSADAFVVCLRPGFDKIGFRQREIKWALEALESRPPDRGFIIPFLVEPCELPHWCKPLHAGENLSEPSTLQELLIAVTKHCGIEFRADQTAETRKWSDQLFPGRADMPPIEFHPSFSVEETATSAQAPAHHKAQPPRRMILAVLVIILSGIALLWGRLAPLDLTTNPKPPDPHLFFVHILQTVVIVFFVIKFHKLFADKDRPFREICDSWQWMWRAWLVAYIWLAIRTQLWPSNGLDTITDALHITCGFAIWQCFLAWDIENAITKGRLRTGEWVAALCGALSFLVALLDRSFRWRYVGPVVQGFYTGLGLTVLAWAMERHSIRVKQWELLSLYLYGMVQILYVLLDILPAPWPLIVFLLFLVLKTILGFAGIDMLKSRGFDG
jgi:hypothetical protein